MTESTPKITLYFLQCSRSIRIAWLLEELALPYELKFYERQPNYCVPEQFKLDCPEATMGKMPVLVDGDIVVQESGAITDYLLTRYDTLHQLLPSHLHHRTRVQTYIHAAEGAFFLHGLVPFYTSLASSSRGSELRPSLVENAGKDMDWLEVELKQFGGKYLVGNAVTAADTMMGFSVQFLLKFGLVPEGREWVHVGKWLDAVEGNKIYQRAVKRTGHKLELPSGDDGVVGQVGGVVDGKTNVKASSETDGKVDGDVKS